MSSNTKAEYLSRLEMKKRIKEAPSSYYWQYGDGTYDGFSDEPVIDYIGMDDAQKMLIYVYSWNRIDLCVRKKRVMKAFGWTSYKVSKLFRQLKVDMQIECVVTFSENTGLINGSGYQIIYY